MSRSDPASRSATTHPILPVLSAFAAAAILAWGCTAATSPAPASPSPTAATPSVAPSVAASNSSAPVATSSPAPTPQPSPSAAPSPSGEPTVGQAPSGPWSAIHWTDTGALPLGPTEVDVNGWSGGYVAFEQSAGSDENGNEQPVTIRAAASTDGVHWSAPTTLDTGFKGMFKIQSIVEGPNGLLALAYPYGDTCGGAEPLSALWSSTDGTTWKRLAMPKAFTANLVETISGGAAGYIAFGTKGNTTETPAIWTSADARTWTARPLPKVSSGKLALDGAVSFDRGYVLAGSVLGEEGCGGAAHVKASIWFSADGASWTRRVLPGALADPNANLVVRSSGDHVVVIQMPSGNKPTAPAWRSTDGLTWTSLGSVRTDSVWASFTDGRHSLVSILPDSGVGLPTLTEVEENGAETQLQQDGGGPVASEDSQGYVYALGPTGLLAVRTDGGASWLGIPSAS